MATVMATLLNPVELHVHLGEGSDLVNNLSRALRFPFKLRQNPTVYPWAPDVQDFQVNQGQNFIFISVS